MEADAVKNKVMMGSLGWMRYFSVPSNKAKVTARFVVIPNLEMVGVAA